MIEKELILIIDDTESHLMQFTDLLKLHDFKCISATSAAEGVDLLKTIKPDLIILDIMMPQTNGFKLCKSLKTNPLYDSIPIILVSGMQEVEYGEKALEAGANDFLKKPITPEELVTRVKLQISNSKENNKRMREINKLRSEVRSLIDKLDSSL